MLQSFSEMASLYRLSVRLRCTCAQMNTLTHSHFLYIIETDLIIALHASQAFIS
jgi:hypothetical protein